MWVHPAAGGGRSGSAYYPGLERMVAGVVDAVEVYNGNWLAERYVAGAEVVAALKLGRTIPHRPAVLRKRRFGLF